MWVLVEVPKSLITGKLQLVQANYIERIDFFCHIRNVFIIYALLI